MPTFDTPDPITVDLCMADGRVELVASDRTDTVVQVDPGTRVGAAGRVRVDYDRGLLAIRTPVNGRFRGRTDPVTIVIELPSRSSLLVRAARVEIAATGILGECRLHGASGQVALERTDDLQAHFADVDLDIARVTGSAEVKSARGVVRIGELESSADVQSGHCTVTIGRAGGRLSVATAGGDVTVHRAESSVTARTAKGSLRVREAARDRIDLATGIGDVEVGIRPGTAAWVDAFTKSGAVRNHLPPRESPKDFAERVEVRTRTHRGEIDIRAARPTPA